MSEQEKKVEIHYGESNLKEIYSEILIQIFIKDIKK